MTTITKTEARTILSRIRQARRTLEQQDREFAPLDRQRQAFQTAHSLPEWLKVEIAVWRAARKPAEREFVLSIEAADMANVVPASIQKAGGAWLNHFNLGLANL